MRRSGTGTSCTRPNDRTRSAGISRARGIARPDRGTRARARRRDRGRRARTTSRSWTSAAAPPASPDDCCASGSPTSPCLTSPPARSSRLAPISGRTRRAFAGSNRTCSPGPPEGRYALWHDRAVFHFIIDPSDQQRYTDVLHSALCPGGTAIIGTFAADGPTTCSWLPVARYDQDRLAAAFGTGFTTLATRREEHHTPANSLQPFTWVALERTP